MSSTDLVMNSTSRKAPSMDRLPPADRVALSRAVPILPKYPCSAGSWQGTDGGGHPTLSRWEETATWGLSSARRAIVPGRGVALL